MNSCGKNILVYAIAIVLLSAGDLAAETVDDIASPEVSEAGRTAQEEMNISVLAENPLPFTIETASDVIKSLGKPLKVETSDRLDVSDKYSKITRRTIHVYYTGLQIDYLQFQYPDEVQEFWVHLTITDPAHVLKFGIKIGMKETELLKVVGQPDKKVKGRFVYSRYDEDGPAEDISFITRNGIVQSIEAIVIPD